MYVCVSAKTAHHTHAHMYAHHTALLPDYNSARCALGIMGPHLHNSFKKQVNCTAVHVNATDGWSQQTRTLTSAHALLVHALTSCHAHNSDHKNSSNMMRLFLFTALNEVIYVRVYFEFSFAFRCIILSRSKSTVAAVHVRKCYRWMQPTDMYTDFCECIAGACSSIVHTTMITRAAATWWNYSCLRPGMM